MLIETTLRSSYDTATDSLYLELRSLPACRSKVIEEDIVLDLGEDGLPVGYDIQYASTKADFIRQILTDPFSQGRLRPA